jgi:hypothetical protein
MVELNLTYNAEKMELTIYPIDSSRIHNIEEVVRCKDCKACPSFDGNGIGYCFEHGNYILENDFCSYGERKDDGVL